MRLQLARCKQKMVNYLFMTIGLVYLSVHPIRAGLYNSSDSLVILDKSNFKKQVINVPNAWIIEFYNTWCGHCVHFAKTWKEFGYDIRDWDHTIKIGALDCAESENTPICRQYEVMMYPSVRLFGPHIDRAEQGQDINHQVSMQSAIVNFITKKEQDPAVKIPNARVLLSEYKGRVADLFSYSPSKADHAVIIIQKESGDIAQQVILDLGHYSMIYVRWMNSSGDEVNDIAEFPAIIVLDRKGNRESLKEKVSTREEMTALIVKHINKKRMTAMTKYDTSIIESDHFLSDESAGDGSNISLIPVNMVDIENAISYAFRNEVAVHKVLSDECLKNLRIFFDTLLTSLPMKPLLRKSLLVLQEYVERKTVEGSDFSREIETVSNSSSFYFPQQRPWIGCAGSQPHLRGFPCSLWTLFHTLTVTAYLKRDNDPPYRPLNVIEAIHGYVKSFFSCRECSQHFQEMYSQDAAVLIRKPGDEVLWLWEAHNKVNKRLRGSLTEDPKHPKIQFPSVFHCPSCRLKNGSFNRPEILLFLTNYYGRSDLSHTYFYRKPSRNASAFHPMAAKSWGFSATDVSLCVVLYLLSTLLIVTGYFMFALKRKMRRRKYIQQIA